MNNSDLKNKGNREIIQQKKKISKPYLFMFFALIIAAIFFIVIQNRNSIDNPAAIGETETIDNGNMNLTILEVIRPVNVVVEETLDPNYEYSMIKLRVECLSSVQCIFKSTGLYYTDWYLKNEQEDPLIPHSPSENFVATSDSLQPVNYLLPGQTLDGHIILKLRKEQKGDLLEYFTYLTRAVFFATH